MKYGFIGCGNMGGAIAKALRKATNQIMISDRSGKAMTFADSLGITYADNESIASQCDRIFLSVKPQMMESVLAPLQPILSEKKPLLITIAAGITIQRINDMVCNDIPVIRIMPNTPVTVGCGMTQYCHNTLVSTELLTDFLQDMRFCGKLDKLDECLIDSASALSGCGPAYMYLFAESLAEGAVACGLPREKALAYAAATMLGSAQMLIKTNQEPVALRNAVCSPGGSTLAGLKVLETQNFQEIVKDCVNAAYNRSKELGK